MKGTQWLIPIKSLIEYKPGPRGFAAQKPIIEAEKAARLAELNKAIRAAKGLPIDEKAEPNTGQEEPQTVIYVSVKEAAELLGQSARAVRHYCGNGRLSGAVKVERMRKGSKDWAIPYSSVEKLAKQFGRPIAEVPEEAAAGK